MVCEFLTQVAIHDSDCFKPSYLSEQKDEGGEVEDVDHADQPVEEHGGTGGRVKTLLPVFQSRVKHLLQQTKDALCVCDFQHQKNKICFKEFVQQM